MSIHIAHIVEGLERTPVVIAGQVFDITTCGNAAVCLELVHAIGSPEAQTQIAPLRATVKPEVVIVARTGRPAIIHIEAGVTVTYAVNKDLIRSALDIPCQAPPFGSLTAIDMKTQAIKWEVPIGTTEDAGPLEIKIGLPIPRDMTTLANWHLQSGMQHWLWHSAPPPALEHSSTVRPRAALFNWIRHSNILHGHIANLRRLKT